MYNGYLFFYLESMIVCVIIFAILLVHDQIKGDRQERMIRFDNVLLAHILYFMVDGVWASIIAGVLPRTQLSVLLVNFLLMFLLALVGNTWFIFTAAMENMPGRATKLWKILTTLPMAVSVICVFIGILIRPEIWVTDTLDTSNLFYGFFILTPISYILAAFVYSVHQARKKENILNRRMYLFVGIYPLSVALAGIIQSQVVNAPIFCYSCTIMMIIFYIMFTDQQISADPLTKLNNRGQLMRFVTQNSSIHKEGLRTYVIMGDVNDFKKINDTYGHAEGDRTLVMIADALRHTAENTKVSPFLGRFGGDEFVIIMYGLSDAWPEEMIREIQNRLEESCREKGLPYIVRMAFGFDELRGNEQFQSCMERADERLYKVKEKMKLERTLAGAGQASNPSRD